MSKIENFNCVGICQQEFCSEKYTHVIWTIIESFRCCILLCEEHYLELLSKIQGIDIDEPETKQLEVNIGKFAKNNKVMELN